MAVGLPQTNATSFGQIVAAVILAAILTLVMNDVKAIEESILDKEYVEQRLSHIEYMINELKEGGND